MLVTKVQLEGLYRPTSCPPPFSQMQVLLIPRSHAVLYPASGVITQHMLTSYTQCTIPHNGVSTLLIRLTISAKIGTKNQIYTAPS
jgi:hypothetical protein